MGAQRAAPAPRPLSHKSRRSVESRDGRAFRLPGRPPLGRRRDTHSSGRAVRSGRRDFINNKRSGDGSGAAITGKWQGVINIPRGCANTSACALAHAHAYSNDSLHLYTSVAQLSHVFTLHLYFLPSVSHVSHNRRADFDFQKNGFIFSRSLKSADFYFKTYAIPFL